MDCTEAFIEEIKNHDCLYDLTNKEYKNVFKKNIIWEEIGKKFLMNAECCKKKWKGLRDTYKKHKRGLLLSSGSGAPTPTKRWKYMDILSFLDNYSDCRQTIGNVEPSREISVEVEVSPNATDTNSLPEEDFLRTQKPRSSCKRKADDEFNKIFADSMRECADAVKEIASAPCPVEAENTSLTFMLLLVQKRISDANVPGAVETKIENRILSVVDEELQLFRESQRQ